MEKDELFLRGREKKKNGKEKERRKKEYFRVHPPGKKGGISLKAEGEGKNFLYRKRSR